VEGRAMENSDARRGTAADWPGGNFGFISGGSVKKPIVPGALSVFEVGRYLPAAAKWAAMHNYRRSLILKYMNRILGFTFQALSVKLRILTTLFQFLI